jgi:hypothetical protein
MYYTATTGRTVGIFLRWADCYTSVKDYAGAKYRKWDTLDQAVQHLNQQGIKHPAIYVHDQETATILSEYCTAQDIQLPTEVECIQVMVHHLGHGIYAEVAGLLGKFNHQRPIKRVNNFCYVHRTVHNV